MPSEGQIVTMQRATQKAGLQGHAGGANAADAPKRRRPHNAECGTDDELEDNSESSTYSYVIPSFGL